MSAPTTPRPRRATWRTILLFLLLGAAANILLTWSLCITLQGPRPSKVVQSVTRFDPPREEWPGELHERRLPDQLNLVTTWRNTLYTGIWDALPPNYSSNDFIVVVVDTGVPLRSMRFRFQTDGVGKFTPTSVIGGWRVSNSVFAATLPLTPVWPGFFLNSLAFATLGWLAIRGPRTLRRALRARRGQCLSCGYVLVGLSSGSPCPECGNIPAANL